MIEMYKELRKPGVERIWMDQEEKMKFPWRRAKIYADSGI